MNTSSIVQKLWNYYYGPGCGQSRTRSPAREYAGTRVKPRLTLRDDGMSYGDYPGSSPGQADTEQLTYLLFLKMADERTRAPYNQKSPVPSMYSWPSLIKRDGDELFDHYRHTLEALGNQKGLLGLIFNKSQNKFQDPAKLRRLIVDLINKETWVSMSADVKGDAYEGLLEKNAQDTKSGAGQYFTPRPLIQAIVDVMAPKPGETVSDPACGTGGFLLAAHDYVVKHNPNLTKPQKTKLKEESFKGWELVQATARLCAMNMLLHGIGSQDFEPIVVSDSLAADPGDRFDLVLTNPPFGKKSSTTIVGEVAPAIHGSRDIRASMHIRGKVSKERDIVERGDFWTTTSNKQLNFVQHVKTLLKQNGRAAVVVLDNVLFEGGAGETIRRKLLHECDIHTLLRLPTGLFYAQGVKANVLFFDKKPASETPWTKKLWIYDLRTNMHFTLKTDPLKREDLDEFVKCYNAENRHNRKATWFDENAPLPLPASGERGSKDGPLPQGEGIGINGRWRAYDYKDLIGRDKASLDVFWLKDELLSESDNLPAPDVIAQEIVNDLEAALEQFREVANDLSGGNPAPL